MSAPKSWESIINDERDKEYFQSVLAFVEQQRNSGKTIYPPQEQVFSAFDMTPFESVRVVILGQDPYHGANQAHGLAFSVLPGVKIPPSLRNMYKELAQDIEGFEIPSHGYLDTWASQGVLMLNTVLTVEEAKAHSHAKCGWETFTDAIIAELNQRSEPIIFLLWGAHAQKKGQAIDADKHHVLVAPHPSPLSARRGFFGCQHFSMTNELLSSINQQPIDWTLPLAL
ncbi:uracil-DNA glycosylase [Vibrio splendidus]|jgi:uracil-DNA glycosylase|uniref:Uracil-DNA glycosylase n=1 Tax=Vibrio splendidus TaxID=29497 RepID=A0AA43JZR1_VIBSP|nr:uracil-DNA glycosylase [Vibrio splendidus]HAS24346.1 uracil-DNA glycosylase [Vibrio sp.]MDH5924165.1 uracil-DNA glycosylase [Vibrio splendidus]MDH6016994.1 uracil-DNA glycosylase [Vibrio splendidus]MDP2588336.1 uracil-DNA glycosylase [Vibrio splendidus]OEE56732.1 uracil-DNA glycosylase [Vibrio splendidus FF-500]